MYMQRALSSFKGEDWTQCRMCNAFCVSLKQEMNGRIDTFKHGDKRNGHLYRPAGIQPKHPPITSAANTSRNSVQEHNADGTKRLWR